MVDIVITHDLLCMQMYYRPHFFYQQLVLFTLLWVKSREDTTLGGGGGAIVERNDMTFGSSYCICF